MLLFFTLITIIIDLFYLFVSLKAVLKNRYRLLNSEEYDVVTFTDWFNCNTVADYDIVRKLM